MAFYIKQNDTSPAIETILQSDDGSVIIDLTDCEINFHMTHSQRDVEITGACEILDEDGGRVRYQWVTGDTSVAGWYRAEFEVTYSDAKIETFPNDGSIWVNVDGELA